MGSGSEWRLLAPWWRNPKSVLADEPTANLDHKIGFEILQLMKKMNRLKRTTFIFCTHDQRVMNMADRQIRIEDGEITMFGTKGRTEWTMYDPRTNDVLFNAPIVDDDRILTSPNLGSAQVAGR